MIADAQTPTVVRPFPALENDRKKNRGQPITSVKWFNGLGNSTKARKMAIKEGSALRLDRTKLVDRR